MAEEEEKPIIIKKVNKGHHGHHGGAWKVAYADFVTAMMAFFLLLWLLNVSTQEEKEALEGFFNPIDPMISQEESGAGGILGGASISTDGAMPNDTANITTTPPEPLRQTGRVQDLNPRQGVSEDESAEDSIRMKRQKSVREQFEERLKQAEQQRFERLAEQIREEIEASPQLQELAENLMIDITPEGLRIQILDQDGESMFPSGSARMYQKTRELLGTVAEIIRSAPNDVSIRGHTDGVQYAPGATYDNWELSADRANASRRVLQETGVAVDKLNDVQGRADTEHLFPDDPLDARNRRISILLLNQDFSDIPTPPGLRRDAQEDDPAAGPSSLQRPLSDEEVERLYEKTRGAIESPAF